MRHFEDFKRTGTSFAERAGEPEENDAALGNVVLNFSYLEGSVSNVVVLLMGGDTDMARIALAEVSFRTKLDMLGSLARFRLSINSDIRDSRVTHEWVRELIQLCRKAETLLNTFLYSSYSADVRSKTTAKARRETLNGTSTVDPSLALDVADFIAYAGMSVEGSPMAFGLADQVSCQGEFVEYTMEGKVVATFRVSGW